MLRDSLALSVRGMSVSTCDGSSPSKMEAYNLIICGTRVVAPCPLLHRLLRNSLEIHQIVALGQLRLVSNALLPLLLLGIILFLDRLHSAQIDGSQVFRLV
jgi:hypothetical protein